MGNSHGHLTLDELTVLAENSGLSEHELKNLHIRFKKFDKDNKGYVTKSDLIEKMKPENEEDRVFYGQICDQFSAVSESGEIDFHYLITTVNAFENDKKQGKLKFLFEFIDRDRNGLVGADELATCFKMIQLPNLEEMNLNDIAFQTLAYADKDGDGFLNFEEFSDFYNAVLNISI